MRLAFIGGGVMGEAMIAGILAKGLTPADAIAVSDINPSRCDLLRERYGIATSRSNREAVTGSNVVVLAIKPQNLGEVANELRSALEPHQLVLSIVAGADLGLLSGRLEHAVIVRAMPNTPAQVGQGMTVWIATGQVTDEQRETVRTILSALGKEIEVFDEKYMDMATAVSGSGPAYVFLFLEALTDAAVHIGLPREMAQHLVLQTILGSTLFGEESGRHPAELKNMVTSPGGTTAEGLLRLERGRLRAVITEAVVAAYEKTRLLGG